MSFLKNGFPQELHRTSVSYSAKGKGRESFNVIDADTLADKIIDQLSFVQNGSATISSNEGEFLCEWDGRVLCVFQKDMSGFEWEDDPVKTFA